MTATDVNLTGGAVFDEKSAIATPIRADDPYVTQALTNPARLEY